MPRSGRVNTDGGAREALRKMTRASGVIEVDVSYGHDGEIIDPEMGQSVVEVIDGSGRPTFDEDPIGRVEEVAGQTLCLVVHERVDLIEIVTEWLDRHLWHRPGP